MEHKQTGRPRSAAVDDAILQATRSLLVDGGYAEISIDRVAAHAGVGKQTVYRRFPSKAPMVAAAVQDVYAHAGYLELTDTGDLIADLRAWLRGVARFISKRENAALLRALIAAAAANPNQSDELYWQITELLHRGVVSRLEAAAAIGEIRSDADLTATADALIGSTLYRMLSESLGVNKTIARFDGLVEVLCAGLRGRS
ncbi:TetR/AcrR family transcriptional regulator [Mycolicibacterium sp. P9-22]|uniref:TetR/AcrR family transcriptional regulator n=1 Tax=Mycolicibacterium sp. P9-22 TaxID=2024613 RepID=UPI0011EDF5D1|nr:TetR/AcrR family transcriptional regulator [Mycolicibacterium sp. P9-22]KAA0115233.1 TetR/AcrR family transcriptional regulator [Mycolicibacterium sp. P9-22]